MRLTPTDLVRLFGGRLEGDGEASAPLAAIETDSRRAGPGSAFVALAGERLDGHAYVGVAARAGAALAVVAEGRELADGAPALLLRVPDTAAALRRACRARLDELGCAVVGVTGSVGKTSAKELCALALGGRGAAATPGNLNTWTGIPLSVLRLDPPVGIFVAEMGMSASGEIRDLCTFTHPVTGVLLNVGLSHIELLGSLAAIGDAKAELLEALPAGGSAVCNADDPEVRRVARRSPAPVTWFGLGEDADYRAVDIVADRLEGVRCRLVGPDGSAPLRLRVPGLHTVRNACAAAAVAGRHGVGSAEAADRLAAFEAPPQRGVVSRGLGGALIVDDSYNASPASLTAALEVLLGSGAARRLAVLGDMLELGDHAAPAHAEAGRQAARAATALIAVGEHAPLMVEAAVAAGMPAGSARVAGDVDEAATLARAQCDGATVVLVKASHGVALERVVERLLR
ncbi:MAG TPA: UDP-N-acetylmuramoyl-tripeptide--D-alanyl-D-alanine ligase [Candidatus Dormibacteraeota bacterium]|nr:UDP-N-acetylmuramoyl-tripeptide--D-alanyl-D-alanine ligase [Candidatus Dormibacteraeota bacterium]